MPDLIFNGKFLTARATGVHRAAEELIRAVDRRLAECGSGMTAAILHPRGVRRELPLNVIPHRRVGRRTGPLWEQTDLPRHARDGLLINLCNLGPVASRNAITMIHDAQVRDAPQSYTPAFRAYYNAIQPVIGRRHRAILTVSAFARDRLIACRTAPPDAISVIPNGADHVWRTAPDRAAPNRFGLQPGRYVLALANAQPHKNIRTLTRAFGDPSLGDLTLALFGDDPLHAIDADAGANIVHLGRVTDAELFGLIAKAAAFACPSRTEGFGLPPLEAMALGAPVIASPRGALPEVLGEAALYADPDTPKAWADAIQKITDDTAERRRRVEAGRARAALFQWDHSAEAMLTLIASLKTPLTRRAA